MNLKTTVKHSVQNNTHEKGPTDLVNRDAVNLCAPGQAWGIGMSAKEYAENLGGSGTVIIK
jgi:hypothetical protein